MSEQLFFPWVSASVLLPLGVALWAWRQTVAETARRGAVYGLAGSFLMLVAAGAQAAAAHGATLREPLPGWAQWVAVDALNALPLPLYAALALGLVALAPRRKVTPHWTAGVLLLSASTLAAYAADNLALLALAWTASIVPFLFNRFFSIAGEAPLPALARGILAGSAVMMIAGAAVLVLETPGADWHARLSLSLPRTGQPTLLFCAFGFLMVAVFLRKGLAPAHSWVLTSYERGPLLPLTLLFNGHLGAFLIARLILPALPDVSRAALPLLGDLGLLTAGYTALLAVAERKPRRLLALLAISQASFLVVGLESGNPDAIAGALVHWQVVVVATALLTAVYTGIEARLGAAPDGRGFLGLALGAPRLAVFFLAGGLALVGLPLTLGFCAEDLLLHGTLETHPHLGIVMPIVTALNAFHVVRLFAALFLGKPVAAAPRIADALPRERWVLTAAMLFLLVGGLRPAAFVHFPAAAAERLAALLGAPAQTAVIKEKE